MLWPVRWITVRDKCVGGLTVGRFFFLSTNQRAMVAPTTARETATRGTTVLLLLLFGMPEEMV